MTDDDARHPLHARLDVLVGRWESVAANGDQLHARGVSEIAWQDDGVHLVKRDTLTVDAETDPGWVEHAPRGSTMIIGLDDGAERYTVLYSDSRGVYRVYQMTLSATGAWTIWRDQPGFDQRYLGQLDPSGDTITGSWELRTDETWSTDFNVTYRRIG